MKKFLLILLLAAPAYGYDVEAVYADYLTATSIYNSRGMGADERQWVQAFSALGTLSNPKDKADYIKEELLPKAQRLAEGAREIQGLFKTKEASEGLGYGLTILTLCEDLSGRLLEAFQNTNNTALAEVSAIAAKITALEAQRAEQSEAFLKKLRKEMRKAKMPQGAIDNVK